MLSESGSVNSTIDTSHTEPFADTDAIANCPVDIYQRKKKKKRKKDKKNLKIQKRTKKFHIPNY